MGDKDCILNYMVQGQEDPFARELALMRANGALHARLALAAWPQAVERGCVQDFDYTRPGSLCLPEMLKEDDERQCLTLSLPHMEAVTDKTIQDLSQGFVQSLDQLHLSFEGCQ